jgi:ABC-type transport system involved in multi-copper enzyme maturation permease subunit
MTANLESSPGGQLSASVHLLTVSILRQLRSRHSLINLLLLGLAILAVIAWSIRRERSAADFIEHVFLTVYVSFLLPIYCLSYGSACIASDREERTLVYLLVTPLPRPLIFLAKSAASLILSLAWTMGGLGLLCVLAGTPGRTAMRVLWPGIFSSTLAYVALFLLLSVTFRRATIVALAYALFLEVLIGNLPGIAKRMAISFYTRCLVFEPASELGMELSGLNRPELFLPIAASTAESILYIVSGVLFLAGMLVFTFREYAR